MKRIHAALLILNVLLISSRANAELVLAVTVFRELVTFDSATPGAILSSTAIEGLTGQNQSESIAGIDFRPATGQLYALGNAPGNIYRIYTVNPTTAVATQVGADISLISGTFMGFDFNPVVDRLRIVTDADQNHRFHPDTGALVFTDPAVAYAAGDANQGANPNIVGAAYNNNFAGATSTILFDIDSTLNILTTQNPANDGTLNTVGALGVDFQTSVGFDISGLSGTAFATSADFVGSTQFYSIDLSTGAAALLGDVGTGLLINDIAVGVGQAIAVPEPTSLGLTSLVVIFLTTCKRNRRFKFLGT